MVGTEVPSRYKTIQKPVSKTPFGYYTNKDFASSNVSTATVDTADEAGEQIDLKERSPILGLKAVPSVCRAQFMLPP